MKYISILLNSIFTCIILLFAFDNLSILEIKNQTVKSFIYYGLLFITPLTLIWNLLFFKTRKQKVISVTLPSLALIMIFQIGLMRIIFWSSAWKTQTIIYQNKKSSFKKIEFQMQDIGAFGYNKRTVEVIYFTNSFMIVKPITKPIKRNEWVRIDKDINELGLKLP